MEKLEKLLVAEHGYDSGMPNLEGKSDFEKDLEAERIEVEARNKIRQEIFEENKRYQEQLAREASGSK